MITLTGSTPPTDQIRDQTRGLIVTGQLAAHNQLPSAHTGTSLHDTIRILGAIWPAERASSGGLPVISRVATRMHRP